MIRPEASTCPSRNQYGGFWVICAGQDSDVQGLCSHLHPLGSDVPAPSRNLEMRIPRGGECGEERSPGQLPDLIAAWPQHDSVVPLQQQVA